MNNVFAQIALIMLIGLAAKNAILIVEFAKMQQERAWASSRPRSAAKLRFRPILMTAFAFILGVVPLLTASAERRPQPRRAWLGTVRGRSNVADRRPGE